MGDRSPDIFDTEEEVESNEENVEEPEGELEEEQQEEEEKENSSSSEEDEEPDYDPWLPLRKKVRDDLEDKYIKEVKRFLDMGKTQEYAENAALNALLPLSRRRLRRIYLQRLIWIHRIKRDALHRKVMNTLHRFIDEDDMDFEEAAESAVEKRKFLLNRVLTKKVLPEEPEDDDDDEEEERTEEVEGSVN